MLLKPLKIDDHPLAQGTSDERPHVQTCPAQDRIASVVSRASEDTSSVTQSRAPNVTSQRRSIEAIDIESDGILHNHNGHYDSCGTPRFDRSLQPKSMRIMFCLMPDVFAYGRVGNTRSNGRCDESQKFASCTVCRRTNPVDQVCAVAPTSSRASINSAISPLTVVETSKVCRAEHATRRHSSSRNSGGPSQREEYDQRWKSYNAACGVTCRELSRFWNHACTGSALTLGTNMTFDEETEQRMRIWNNAAYNERHVLRLGDDPLAFFTLPSCILLRRIDGVSLEVECRLFGVWKADSLLCRTPLHHRLSTTFTRKESITRLFGGDLDLGVRLLTLELINCVLEDWLVFLNIVHYDNVWLTEDRSVKDATLLSHDIQHIGDFARSIRDVVQASEQTIRAIDLDSLSVAGQHQAFDRFVFENRLLQKDAQNVMHDIESYIERFVVHAERYINERQETSLRHLTIVAAIFLPLTLASSLLSMDHRVSDLKAIWWDWLGIVFIIGLAVLGIYLCFARWHKLRRRFQQDKGSTPFHELWSEAKRNVLARESKPGKRRRHLVPTVTRNVFSVCKYVLCLSVVASFLVGMFTTVSKGAKTLGYSFGGTFALCVVIIAMWRTKSLISLHRHVGGQKNDADPDEESARRYVADAERATRLLFHEKPARPVELIGIFKVMVFFLLLYVTAPISAALKATFRFFCGELPGKVLQELLRLNFETIWPDREYDFDDGNGNMEPNKVLGLRQPTPGWQLQDDFFGREGIPHPGKPAMGSLMPIAGAQTSTQSPDVETGSQDPGIAPERI